MIRKLAHKFSSVRMQLVASVFVAVAPALVLTYIVNQDWFWRYAPEWLRPYATDVPWVSFAIGMLALFAAWFGGEHFILRQVRAMTRAAQQLARGNLEARTGLHHVDGELGELAKTLDEMAAAMQVRAREHERVEKNLVTGALRQTVVSALGQFALTNNDFSALANQAVMFISQTISVEYAAVWKHTADRQLLLLAGAGWKAGSVGNEKLSANKNSQITFTLETGEVVCVSNAKLETRFAVPSFLEEHGVVGGVTIAIPTRGNPFGVLSIHSTAPREFTPDEVQFLLAVANAIGAAADRLNLEAQLRQSQKMESVGQLAAGVAHDFNNMLTIIQGHSSALLSKSDLPSEMLAPVQSVYFAAERAAGLTKQLLMFSRRNVMQPEPLDLREVVGNLNKMLPRLLGETVQLECFTSDRLPLIQADNGMIEQVIVNLSVNARDAMPRGGTLTISVEPAFIVTGHAQMHPDARSGSFVRLRVSDTGHGMDSVTLTRIFEPFFTTKDIGKGTGLGLATVYGIVKQHEGWIEVNSEPEKGTRFDIYFPATGELAIEKESETAAVTPVVGGSETILVVEDEPVLREMTCVILEGCGYKILQAGNGREALDVWNRRTKKIDLLLTDMVMPEGVSGMDLAERILVTQPDVRIIFTSGYTATEINPEVLAKTHARFLQKPYTHSDLAKCIRDCLDQNLKINGNVVRAEMSKQTRDAVIKPVRD
ncbi:MAG TPA: ATP-binding protein [Verrucomicrobiae bacterium]|nr:ATP-binding protein [Verrucomicrobiae bacterium]